MKETVGRWTAIQAHLPHATPEEKSATDDLWHKIEHRTIGKRGSTNVSIAIEKDEQPYIDAALESLKPEDEKFGHKVEYAG